MTLLLQENQVSEEGVKTKSNQSLFYSYSSWSQNVNTNWSACADYRQNLKAS